MPFEGAQLDELLNGFLDGELSELESARVKQILADNPAAQTQLDQLEVLRSDLKALSRMRQATAPGLSHDFTSRVMAAAHKRANLDNQASNKQAERVELVDRPPVHTRSITNRRIVLVGLAIAASLMVMINSPGWMGMLGPRSGQPVDADTMAAQSTDVAAEVDLQGSEPLADAAVESGEAVQLTSQWMDEWRRQLTIILVVDMTLSSEAVSNDYVANLLAAHSIPVAAPVVADQELLAIVEKSRMSETVQQPEGRDALIYFVHANTQAVDKLVQTFLDDFANIPTLRTDIAFDAPANQLVRKIVESSDGKLAIHETFAAPVSDEEGPRPSPFSDIGPQGKLVASSARGRASPTGGASLGGGGGEGKSSVLLLVRIPR